MLVLPVLLTVCGLALLSPGARAWQATMLDYSGDVSPIKALSSAQGRRAHSGPNSRLFNSLRTTDAVGDRTANYSTTADPLISLEAEILVPTFIESVAISGDTIIVGSPAYPSENRSDSAYVLVRNGTTWSLQQKLLPHDPSDFLGFGVSVAISGDTAVVGTANTNSAYVFVRCGTTWTQQQKLRGEQWFGYYVAISGDTIVVGGQNYGGSPAAAYVFVRNGTTWIQQQKLTASGHDRNSLGFGRSVTISGIGDTILVGDPSGENNKGAVYVFERNGATWNEQAKLTASDGAYRDSFGSSVAFHKGTAVVGAPGDDNTAGTDAGSVYVLVRNGTTWTEQQKLTTSDSGNAGHRVSISGDIIVATDYVFVRSGTTWSEQAKLIGGRSAISGDKIVVGRGNRVYIYRVNGHSEAASNSETAYTSTTCPDAVPAPVLDYAPLVYLHPDDQYMPADVTHFIQNSDLRWSHGEGCDDHSVAERGSIQASKLGTAGVLGDLSPYSHNPNRLLWKHPAQQGDRGSTYVSCSHHSRTFTTHDHTRPYDKNRVDANDNGILRHPLFEKEGFFLNLENNENIRKGLQNSSGNSSVYSGAPVYYEYVPNHYITYWFFYAYNKFHVGDAPDQEHEGDWERISIRLDSNDHPDLVAYYQHDRMPEYVSWVSMQAEGKLHNGTHPIVFSAKGSHASYSYAGTIEFEEHGIPVADHTKYGPAWSTWNSLANVKKQPWYGYGGAWGEVGDGYPIFGGGESFTGPRGPSKYKDPKPAEWTSSLNPSAFTLSETGYTRTSSSQIFNNLNGNKKAIPANAQSALITEIHPGNVLISEFRLSGPSGARDEFIELYNNTDAPIDLDGYILSAFDPAAGSFQVVLPSMIIPPRGHALIVDTGAYSLTSLASDDFDLAGCECDFFIDTEGVELLNPDGVRADAAGFVGNEALYREGAGLSPIGTSDGEYSFVRKTETAGGQPNTGRPQDTNDNAADFIFISTTGGSFGGSVASVLGAPGPENLSSPIQRNRQIRATLLDPAVGASSPKNRFRDSTPNQAICNGNCPLGTLSIRRTYTNNTGGNVTRLRFRVIDMTTLNSPGSGSSQAILRLLSSPTISVTNTVGELITVRGLTLEEPPAQPNGGGLNSSLVAGTITTETPLTHRAKISVQFLLGIQQGGNFSFLVNVEALP